LADEEKKKFLHENLCHFFMGTWSEGRAKPFEYSELQRQRFGIKEKVGKADRKVPQQPNIFNGQDQEERQKGMRWEQY